jgi:2'-5' RNA ligase
MESQAETKVELALVVLVPGADVLIGPFRKRSDPSASEGMPAHITINYPFQPNQPNRELLIKELADLFSGFPCVRFELTELRQFPDTLYLAVKPEQPFRNLIETVANRYPESPPYRGVITEVVPHVTVAEINASDDIHDVSREFAAASRGKLPIESKACQVWLLDCKDNLWSKTIAFNLAD